MRCIQTLRDALRPEHTVGTAKGTVDGTVILEDFCVCIVA